MSTNESLAFARDEVFADTYAHATGFPTKNERSRLIKQYFGNTLKYMKEYVHGERCRNTMVVARPESAVKFEQRFEELSMASRNNTRTNKKRRDTVARWRASGLSQAEFCRREGIAQWQLSTWKRSEESGQAKDHQLQRLPNASHGLEFAAVDESAPEHSLPGGWLTAPFVPVVTPGQGQVDRTASSEMTVQLFFSRPAIQVVISGASSEDLQTVLSNLMEFGA